MYTEIIKILKKFKLDKFVEDFGTNKLILGLVMIFIILDHVMLN